MIFTGKYTPIVFCWWISYVWKVLIILSSAVCIEFSVQQSRLEYIRVGIAVTSTPQSFPNLGNPLHKRLGALHFEQSSVPCWWRYQQSHLVSRKWLKCLNLDSACVSKSQRTCVAISVACLHLSHLGLSASPSLNRCPFRWQCPVSNPVIILDFGVTLEYCAGPSGRAV